LLHPARALTAFSPSRLDHELDQLNEDQRPHVSIEKSDTELGKLREEHLEKSGNRSLG
jgi:hypothetical protein